MLNKIIIMIRRFFYYGIFGIFMEIVWTGVNSFFRGDLTLRGNSSVIMFFIYGMVVFLEPVFELFKNQCFFVRIVTYSVFIFAVEYYSGILLTSIGVCPWHYSSAFSIDSVIRLDYIVIWAIAGYAYERLYLGGFGHKI